MWNWIKSILGFPRNKPQMASLFESFTYPTMTDLTNSQHLNLEYPGIEEDDGLEEEFEIVTHLDHEGNIVDYCVIGNVNYNQSFYLVCVRREELAESFEESSEPYNPSSILILQAFMGVGSDTIYHEVKHQELQDQVFEAFIAKEAPEEH